MKPKRCFVVYVLTAAYREILQSNFSSECFFSVCIIKIGNALIVRNQNCNLHVEQRSEAQVFVPFLLMLSFFSISMSFQVQMFKLFP